MLVLLLEWNIPSRFLSLAHDLALDPFCSDIVEDQLGAGGALGVYPPPDTNLDILEMLASLDGTIAVKEVSEVCCDVEFVGIRIGSLALAQLLDLAASDFVILLPLISQLILPDCCPLDVRWA